MNRYFNNNKYNNKKTIYDGIKFDSKKESKRYAELKLLEKSKIIKNLKLQVAFELQPSFKHGNKTIRSIKYVADFTYYDSSGKFIIEDVKSEATRKDKVYILKKKMMLYKGLEINEV